MYFLMKPEFTPVKVHSPKTSHTLYMIYFMICSHINIDQPIHRAHQIGQIEAQPYLLDAQESVHHIKHVSSEDMDLTV